MKTTITIEVDDGRGGQRREAPTGTLAGDLGKIFAGGFGGGQTAQPAAAFKTPARPVDPAPGGRFGFTLEGIDRTFAAPEVIAEDDAAREFLSRRRGRLAPKWSTLLALDKLLGVPSSEAAREIDQLVNDRRSGKLNDTELAAGMAAAVIRKGAPYTLEELIEALDVIRDQELDDELMTAGSASSSEPASIFEPQTAAEAADWAERDKRENEIDQLAESKNEKHGRTEEDNSPGTVFDLLGMIDVGREITLAECKQRTPAELKAAADYASARCLRASDHEDVPLPVCPEWLRQPGPDDAFSGVMLVGEPLKALKRGALVKLRRPVWSYPLQVMMPTGSILEIAGWRWAEQPDEIDTVDLRDPKRPELGAVILEVGKKYLSPLKS